MKQLLAAILFSICAVASATEIVAVGRGVTEDEALLHAKQEATNRVVGSFLFGRTDIDDNKVNESIHQYNGGFVRKYEVISSTVEHGSFQVAIRADVDDDKINDVIVSTGKDVSPDASSAVANADESAEKLANVLHVLMTDKQKFATTIQSIKYATHGATTRVTIDFDIVWSPKWYDDVYTTLKAAGTELSASDNRDFGVCFSGDRKFLMVSIECYDAHYDMAMPRDVIFDVYMEITAGYSVQMFNVYVNMTDLYYPGQYDPRQVGMFVMKNGVKHVTTRFDVKSQALKRVTKFEIEIE